MNMMEQAIIHLRTALRGPHAAGEGWDFEAIEEAAKIVSAARTFFEHDGGPGSIDYDARKIFDAKHEIKAVLGFYTEIAKHMEMRNKGEV